MKWMPPWEINAQQLKLNFGSSVPNLLFRRQMYSIGVEKDMTYRTTEMDANGCFSYD